MVFAPALERNNNDDPATTTSNLILHNAPGSGKLLRDVGLRLRKRAAIAVAATGLRAVCTAAIAAVSLMYHSASFAEIVFQSMPTTDAVVGERYSYRLVASDVGGGDRDGGRGGPHDRDGPGERDEPDEGDDPDDGGADGSGIPGPAAIVFAAPLLPTWLELHGDVLEGTPTPIDVGPHSVLVTAVDPNDPLSTAMQMFTINVSLPPNAKPTLDREIAPDPQTAAENQDYRFDVSFFFSDPDGEPLTFSASGLPDGLAANSGGLIAGRPTAGTAGPHTVTVTASDGTDSVGDSFTLEVAAANKPPALTSAIMPDPQSAAEGESYRFNVSGFFKDPDGDALTFSASGLPAGLAVDAASGIISGKPAAGSAGASPYRIEVAASDGSASASGRFTLEVAAPDRPPSLPDPPPRLSTPEDTPLTLTAVMLEAVDEDPASLTVVLSPPAGGAHFEIKGATVHPEANFSGTLHVEARVKDAAAASNAVTVTIDVTAVNDAPSIDAIPEQSAAEGAPFSLDLGPFVSDAENDALTFSATDLPSGLALDAATGTIAGTPPVGSARDYRVELAVSDGAASGKARFVLEVAPAGRADLAATAGVAPNPVLLDQTATWTIGARNTSSLDVANVAIDAVFSGGVPLRFDPVDPACTLDLQGSETHVSCKLGPIAGGATAAVDVSASSTQAGHAAVAVSAAIADVVPIDDDAANDTARISLDITQSLNTEAAQQLDAPGAAAAAAGDLDGDGRDDLAVAASAGTLVFLNGASPNDAHKLAFTNLPLSYTAPSDATDVAAADLDGDGDIDLVVASASAPNAVLVNDGTAAFEPQPLADRPHASRAVAAADVNGDSRIDLVFANDGENEVYLNDGSGGFTETALPGAAQNSADVVLANLAGDALPDLVFANADGDATVYVSSGGLFTPVTIPTGPATSAASADFDADGVADLVFGQSSGINHVYLNTSSSTPSFFPAAELDGVATVDVLAGDLDLDGSTDVLTVDAVAAHALYTNAGGASTQFLLHPQQFSTKGAASAVLGKLNGDDRVDVAIAGGDAVAVFLNDGAGDFGLGDTDAPVLTLNGESTIDIAVGDQYVDAGATANDAVDGDLTSEIMVTNPVDTQVIGTYTVSYDVADSAGNAAPTLQRSVDVKARDAGGGGGGGSIGVELGFLALAPLLARLRRLLLARPGRNPLFARLPRRSLLASLRRAALGLGAQR